jgi:hypothetical protein
MPDEFPTRFDWITGVLEQPLTDRISADSPELPILQDLQNGRGKRDAAALLNDLTGTCGDPAGAAVEKYPARIITRDWRDLGAKEARPGTEIDDFIRVLWNPLKDSGFEFAAVRSGDGFVFSVTRCPIHGLAERTGLRDWLNHLACAAGFCSTPAFGPRIEFSRTRTLVRDGAPCNHTGRYRAAVEMSGSSGEGGTAA